MVLEDDIDLFFLDSGNTKNICYGAFVNIEQRLFHSDVHNPD